MIFFFINSKPVWKHVFITAILYLFDRSFVRSENKILRIKEHIIGYTP